MNKLTITLIIVAVATMVMANWGIDRLFIQTQKNNISDSTLQENHIHQLGLSLAATLSESSRQNNSLRELQVTGLDANLFNLTELGLPQRLAESLLERGFLVLESEQEISYLYVLTGQSTGLNNSNSILQINRPFAVANQQATIQLALTALFYICIVLVLLLWSRPLIKRLINLRNTTRAFGNGELQTRIDNGSSFYISDIEQEFNRMADRIETLIADNKLLSNAVSHDLKTPLARLRFGIDVLEDAESEEQRQKYFTKVNRDLQEMEALVDTLLCYARLDQAKLELNNDKVDLVAFINELTASLEIGPIQVNWHPPIDSHYVIGDQRYLSLLINNLVTNACQHAKQSVVITLDTIGNTTKLLIEDDGPGIPLAQRQAVLKPFVRIEEARSTPGHGMGLAIVNRITHWHRWRLSINDSKALGGAQVEVTIPAP